MMCIALRIAHAQVCRCPLPDASRSSASTLADATGFGIGKSNCLTQEADGFVAERVEPGSVARVVGTELVGADQRTRVVFGP
jgi:hypothetical protein